MAPAAWISSVPGLPMMSCNCIGVSRVGFGMGPSFCEANCDRLVVLVAGLTARCAGGVVVKNGWANRNGVDAAPAGFRAFAGAAFFVTFLTGRFELFAFLAIDRSPEICLPFRSRRLRRGRPWPVVDHSVWVVRRRRLQKKVSAIRFGNMPGLVQWS